MPPKSRIALLVTGALPDHLQQTHGDYHALFTAFLRASLPQPHDFVLDPYDVVHKMEYPTDDQLKSYDALMYTGSASNAFDDVEWINTLVAFTARIVHDHPTLKLIGICFGHQIIARALGGSCVRNDTWEVGPTSLTLTPLGKSLFGVDTLTIQQMHRDHVPTLPARTLPLASTPTSPIQGFVRFFPSPSSPSDPPSPSNTPSSDPSDPSDPSDSQTLPNTHILSLQGHPEFIEPIVSHLVSLRAQTGIIPPSIASGYTSRKDWTNDGVRVVGRAVWGVLGVGVGV